LKKSFFILTVVCALLAGCITCAALLPYTKATDLALLSSTTQLQKTAWLRLAEDHAAELTAQLLTFPEAHQKMLSQDSDVDRQVRFEAMSDQLIGQGLADDFRVVSVQGSTLFGRSSDEEALNYFSEQAFLRRTTVSGLGELGRRPMLQTATPLFFDGDVKAVALASSFLEPLLTKLSKSLMGDVALVDSSGNLIYGLESRDEFESAGIQFGTKPKFVQKIASIGNKTYALGMHALENDLGETVAYLLAFSDISASYIDGWSHTAVASMGVTFVMVLFSIWFYRVLLVNFLEVQDKEKRQLIQLNKVNSELEENSRVNRQFLENISHEIRTPMNGITGMADMIEDTTLNDEQKEYFGILKSSITSLTKVINDVLDFSSIEAGKLKLKRITFDLRKFTTEFTAPWDELATSKGLIFTTDVSDQLPRFLIGDSERLSQVLNLIIDNAIKFTPSGGTVQLNINPYDQSHGDPLVHFVVSDSGIGIPEQKQKVLKDSSRTNPLPRRYGGMGLGLAIATRIVKLMGGNFWMHSEKGKGSEFHFTVAFTSTQSYQVPQGTRNQQAGEKESHKDIDLFTSVNKRVKTSQNTGKKLNVLLVEDIPVNQRVGMHILKKMGHTVTVANNGREALALLEIGNYDLILMDVHMPEMDGLEATLVIRAKEKETGDHMPIIALTARVLTGDKETCIEVGMDDYISKPITRDALANVLEKYMFVTEVV